MLQGDGQFAYWNEEFLRLAGHGATTGMDGDGWWRNMCADEPRRQRMQRRFEAARARAGVTRYSGGADTEMERSFGSEEYQLIGADGCTRSVSVAGLLLDEGCLLILQDQSQRKMAEEEIRRLAFYDALTGLPNRRLLVDRLQQAWPPAVGAGAAAPSCCSMWTISRLSMTPWVWSWATHCCACLPSA